MGKIHFFVDYRLQIRNMLTMKKKDIEKRFKKAGLTQAEIARQLGVERVAVFSWITNGIPPRRLVEFERVTGIHRHLLNPGLFEGYKREETE